MKSTLAPAAPARLRPRGILVVLLDPLAVALVLAGVFDGLSDNWLHAVVLICAAAAVWADTWYRASGHVAPPSRPLLRSRDRRGPRQWTLVVLGVGVVLVYAVAAGAYHRYTWQSTAAVVVPGAVALVIAWRGPLRARPVPPPVGRLSMVLWYGVLVTGGLWELSALLMQPSLQDSSPTHPTISFLMDSVLASHTGRTLTLAIWLGLGWWLLAQAPGTQAEEEPDDLP